MKEAKLPNGQTLVFPDNTSDKVIKATVDRIVKTKTEAEWTSDHVKAVIREMNASQGQFDIERAQIDHFGPAIEKQIKVTDAHNKTIIEVIRNFVSDLVKSGEKNNKNIVDGFSPLFKDHIKQMVGLAHKIETMSLKNVENNVQNHNTLTKAINFNSKIMSDLVTTQNRTNEIMTELVAATKASKKVLRDKQGNIVGVDVE